MKDLKERILTLHKDDKWLEILNLLKTVPAIETRRFLWVIPEISDVFWINDVMKELRIRGIISLGCGSGLLEWIIARNTGCEVIGVEVDRKWWQSNYASPQFIRNSLVYADENDGKIPLETDYALLFCYFNNGRAFYDYMLQHRGNVVIVVGPSQGQNRHTNPLPFDEKFADLGWRSYKSRELKQSRDCVNVFVRNKFL